MEFTFTDVFAIRDDLGIDGLLYLILVNVAILAILRIISQASRTAAWLRRHNIIDEFIKWNARVLGGPSMFPFRMGLANAAATWLMIGLNALWIFELPVIGLVFCMPGLFILYIIVRRPHFRRTHDDPINARGHASLDTETPKWWQL